MSKVLLRLIVVIAVVVVSVAITIAIVYKPNYNQVIYNQWKNVQNNARYDLQSKIDKKIVSNETTLNDKTLRGYETNIANISLLAMGVDEYLEYLVAQSKYSTLANEETVEILKEKLKEFYDNRFYDDGVGYWIDYYYNEVQRDEFILSGEGEDIEINKTNHDEIINTIISKWIENEKIGIQAKDMLKDFVADCVFESNNNDLKNVLFNFRAEFATLFFNASNYSAFETLHFNEYKNLISNIKNKMNTPLINYNEEDLLLCDSYFEIPKETITKFLSSEDKESFILNETSEKTKSTLNILNSYLGSN